MKMNKYKIVVLSVITLVIVFLVFRVFAEPYRLHGDCMEPTFMDGRLYFLNRAAPYMRSYRINDIVLFKYEGKVWISRIVALGNDMIEITEGSIVVNGVAFEDPEIHRNWSNWKHGDYAVDKSFQVPSAHVFVLSDNLAAQHDDSRTFGPVPNESIIGRVW